MKYNVTNVSAKSKGGARNVFLTEAGKLLKPGESTPCNRVDDGTRELEKAEVLLIETGDFAFPSVFDKKKPKVVEDDEEATVTSPEDVAVRKAEALAMDKRIAADKAATEAKAKEEAKASAAADKARAEAEKAKAEKAAADKAKSDGKSS